MAVSGEPFCKSAWNGFLLNLKYLAKFYFANTIANLFVLAGVIAVTCINTGIAWVMFKYALKETDVVADKNSHIGPLIAFITVSFITAILFL